MRSVLADTGPLYALVDSDDQYHVRARGEVERLARERITVTVACPILLEAYSLILHRLGIKSAHAWVEEITAGVGLLNPHREDYARAAQSIRRYTDQPITLVDGVVAVLSDQLDLPVWTYDHHFDVMGAQVWR
jgi:predicted nucleic acid-binding protein